jgi:hypothetical protein
VLPTRLGNLLRRAETSAGERYGLTTVVTYGRLYPHLSDRLDRQMAMQLDLLDTMSAFTLVFSGQALATTPLVARFDGWSLLPAAFVVFALIAYRAACQTARHHAVTLATTYDLHRFDMLKALHLPLPGDAEQEYIENLRLSEFFGNEPLLSESERADWKYVHPSAESSTDGSRAQPRPGVKGDSGSSGE